MCGFMHVDVRLAPLFTLGEPSINLNSAGMYIAEPPRPHPSA